MAAPFDPSAFRDLGRSDWTIYDDRRCIVGESPVWDHDARRLYWVDVARHNVLFAGDRFGSWSFEAPVAAVALANEGDVVVSSGADIWLVGSETEERRLLASIDGEKPGFRINEIKADRNGHLWAGTLDPATWSPEGTLYLLGPNGVPAAQVGQLCVPNGMAWSLDGARMYLTDSPRRSIDVFDYDERSASLRNRRRFAKVAEGISDGAVVDEEDHLWCATPGGWCITRYAPTGAVERVIRLPVQFPTACTFGGPGLDTLFVTSAIRPLSDEELVQQPAAGCVLAIKTGFKGVTEPRAIVGP